MSALKKDKLLCILPWPEPTEVLDRIKKNYGIEVEYIHQTYIPGQPRANISDGAYFEQDRLKQNSITVLTAVLDVFKDVTILVTLGTFPQSPEAAPELEYVHVGSAGADHVLKSPIFYPTNITFTSSSGIHGPQIGEWVILTMLVRNHHYDFLYEQAKEHTWKKYNEMRAVRDYVGQRFGVLGYGSIGRQGE
jgi:phosphoglycerate dehydrogenase-like enzyme